MRLLFLTQTYPRFAGDTSGPFIRDLARALVRAGHGVRVLLPHGPSVRGSWADDGVEVTSFRYAPHLWEVVGYGRSLEADETVRSKAAWAAPLYTLGAWRGLRRELRRRPYDLVHAHWLVPNGVVAALAGTRVPLAVGLHGSGVFLGERSWVRPLVGRGLKRVRLLTGCSPELVERVRKLGFETDLWRVIPYGVDTETFSPDGERRQVWRHRLGIPPQATVLLSVGRMATKKGFHVLIDTLPQVLGTEAGTHLVLAGGGDRLEELRARARPWGERVHFPGAVEHHSLPDLYRAADVFVLPAVHDSRGNVDGLPNVVLEAMASGLPVVASDISGIPLAITTGSEGLLVPEQDRAALGDALLSLLREPGLRRILGDAARQKAVNELTWDAVARRYAEAYEVALEEKPERG